MVEGGLGAAAPGGQGPWLPMLTPASRLPYGVDRGPSSKRLLEDGEFPPPGD